MATGHDQIVERLLRHGRGGLHGTLIPRLGICVEPRPKPFFAAHYDPMVCVVFQGAKQVVIGDRTVRYDAAHGMIATLDLPAMCQIEEAAPERPFAAIVLELDRDLLAGLAADLPGQAPGPPAPTGFALTPLTAGLRQALDHFLALLDQPEDIAVLAPLREREILYRIFQGPQTALLHQIIRDDGRFSQVRRAVDWIRAHLDHPLRVERLADASGMSVAAFHRNFKAVTAMSPLQYQKMLRLQAARRLLVAGSTARQAAFSVGYESASQFSREYARMFGAPPSREAAPVIGLREAGIGRTRM